MNEFRNNVFYLARKFKNLYNKYLFSERTNYFLIYQYMTCLLTIWTNSTFEIKNKLSLLDSCQFVNSLRINSKECKILLRLESLFNDESVSNTITKTILFYLGN